MFFCEPGLSVIACRIFGANLVAFLFGNASVFRFANRSTSIFISLAELNCADLRFIDVKFFGELYERQPVGILSDVKDLLNCQFGSVVFFARFSQASLKGVAHIFSIRYPL